MNEAEYRRWRKNAETCCELPRGTMYANSFGNGPRISMPKLTPSNRKPITAR